MKNFAGRTAFITGGAQGIGLGIARRLAREGVKLALVDIDAEALKRARAELEFLAKVTTHVLDVRDRDAYARVADAVEAELGPVSLLFNNAGVAGGIAVQKMNYTNWDWVLGVNLQGVVNGIQTFVPRMIERKNGGHVVNTASGAGMVAGGSGFLYTTSKFAVVGMSEALKIELQQAKTDIGVSVLCPGPVATGIIARSIEGNPDYVAPASASSKARIEALKGALADGVGIDEVGDMVLRGMQDDATYIFTDRIVADAVVQRTQAILAAMPGTPDSVGDKEHEAAGVLLGGMKLSKLRSLTLVEQIPAAPEAVFAIVANPHRSGEWSIGHAGFSIPPPATISVGTAYSQTVESMGSKVDLKWTVKRLESPTTFEAEGSGPMGIRLRTAISLSPNGKATQLTVVSEMGGGPLEGAVGEVALKKSGEELQKSLDKLKSLFAA